MKKFLSKIVASIMVIGAVSTFGLGSIAYAISATNVEPDTLAMGMDTNATVTFTPGIDIPADGKIKVTFGAGFDLTNVAVVDGTCSTMDGTFTTGFSGQTVTITRSGDGSINAFGSTEICTISNIKNPVATGTTGTYTIETTDAADSQIEIDSAVSADTIIDTANIPVVSSITAVQRTDGTGVVDIRFDFADGLGDDDGRVKVEYKAGADCSSGTSDPTLDEDTANISASIEALELLVSNAAEYQIGPSSNWITT
ncbi:hypothetical protein HON58_04070, partial [Candidatus Peregrinibacteria bacterium]|nr:hypothetical protein [Candidatus Peregrinibacteria bacterium]